MPIETNSGSLTVESEFPKFCDRGANPLPSNDGSTRRFVHNARMGGHVEVGELVRWKLRIGRIDENGVVVCGLLGHEGCKWALQSHFGPELLVWRTKPIKYREMRDQIYALANWPEFARLGLLGVLEEVNAKFNWSDISQERTLLNLISAKILGTSKVENVELIRRARELQDVMYPTGPALTASNFISLVAFSLARENHKRGVIQALIFANGHFSDKTILHGLRKHIYQTALGGLYDK